MQALRVQEKIEFWDNVWGFKMEPIKQLARSEPLVDTVSSDLVVTNTACLCEIDIDTMTADDIPFAASFEVEAKRDDFVHALVLWFDVHFGTSHKPVRATSEHAHAQTPRSHNCLSHESLLELQSPLLPAEERCGMRGCPVV